MSEDRFDDLGAERRRALGDRLEERDRTHPEGPPRPLERRGGGAGYQSYNIRHAPE